MASPEAHEGREVLLENILENTRGQISDVLRALKDISKVSLRPISVSGFPMNPNETARVFAVYNDGVAFKTLRSTCRLDDLTYYLHRNGENFIYELG